MRVVIVNDTGIARGGASGLAVAQAQEMSNRGLDVTFFAADRQPNPDFDAFGVQTLNAGFDPLMKTAPLTAAVRGLHNGAIANSLRQFIEQNDTSDTVYHVHSWSKTLTAAVFGALSPVASRVFLHAHDFFYACPNGGFMNYRTQQPCSLRPMSPSCISTNCDKRSMAQKAWRVGRQLVLARTARKSTPWAGILMIHPAMRAYFESAGYPAERLLTVRNPAERLCENRVHAEDNRGFLFIGRVEAEKGIEPLIHAAAVAQVPLTVVGDGPLREPLSRSFPDVHFAGWQDRANLPTYLARARALVMPSIYPEPFGLVAAEASLSGLPVLISQTAFLAKEICEAGLGQSIDVADPKHIADVLTSYDRAPAEWIKEQSRRGFAGDTGLSLAPDTWIDALLSHYRTALRAANNRPISALASSTTA